MFYEIEYLCIYIYTSRKFLYLYIYFFCFVLQLNKRREKALVWLNHQNHTRHFFWPKPIFWKDYSLPITHNDHNDRLLSFLFWEKLGTGSCMNWRDLFKSLLFKQNCFNFNFRIVRICAVICYLLPLTPILQRWKASWLAF